MKRISKPISGQIVESAYNKLCSQYIDWRTIETYQACKSLWHYIPQVLITNPRFEEKMKEDIFEGNNFIDVWGDSYLTSFGSEVMEYANLLLKEIDEQLKAYRA